METTKKLIAEQILTRIYQGEIPLDAQVSIREVMLWVDNLRDKYIISAVYANQRESEYEIVSELLSVYRNIDIQYDAERDENYFILPAKPISLYRGMGVYKVQFMGQPKSELIPLEVGKLSLYEDTSYFLEGNYGYYLETETINGIVERRGYIQKSIKPEDLTKKLMIRQITESKDIGEKEAYPLTSEMQEAIITEALKTRPHGFKPTDTVIDNVDG